MSRFGKGKSRGEYGCTRSKQQFNLILTFICAALVAVFAITGIVIWHTRMNILMIPAMICVIPTAQFFVSWLAVCMFDTPPAERYEQIAAFREADMLLCELIVVDEKGNRNGVDFAVVYAGGIVAYQSTKKDTRDMVEITLNSAMKKRGIPMRMKVYRDWDEFIRRLNQLEAPGDEEARKKVTKGKEVLLSVSM